MPKIVKSNVRLFADDCIIYRTIRNLEDCAALQEDLVKWNVWLDKNKLKCNANKSKLINFNRNKIKFSYVLGNSCVPVDKDIRYLGITFSSNLKWAKHIENITFKANRTLNFVIRNLKKCHREVKEKAYLTLVRPMLEYGDSIWDPHQKGLANKLENVQRRAARFVLGRYGKTDSVTDMIKELGWEKLESRRKTKRLGNIYKTFTAKPSLKELNNKLREPDYIGRNDHKHKIATLKQRTDICKFSFLNRGIVEWNNLPEEVFEPFPPSCNVFLNRIKRVV